MVIVHLTAHFSRDLELFARHPVARWFWSRMHKSFPSVIAATLMPDHPHWMALVTDVAWANERFRRICGHLQRKFQPSGAIWWPYPEVDVVPRTRWSRMARYIELNPVRRRLTRDAFSWVWSTAREHIGAVADPVLDRQAHRSAVGTALSRPRRWAKYLMSDDRVTDRTPPRGEVPGSRTEPSFGLGRIAAAAAAASRSCVAAISERGPVRERFAALAYDQGVRNLETIAQATGLTRRRVAQMLVEKLPDPVALAAGRICLADDRLLAQTIAEHRARRRTG